MRAPLLAGLVLLLAAPTALATVTFGRDGSGFNGVQADEPGVVSFRCGLQDPYASPVVDLRVAGGQDMFPDSGFSSYLFIVPILCSTLGTTVHMSFPV
jgi:hypothetical protein